jgi:hypothetical protein
MEGEERAPEHRLPDHLVVPLRPGADLDEPLTDQGVAEQEVIGEARVPVDEVRQDATPAEVFLDLPAYLSSVGVQGVAVVEEPGYGLSGQLT